MLNHFDSVGIYTLKVGRGVGNDVVCDLAKTVPELNELLEIDIVMHNAGKAHFVPQNEAEGKVFFDV